MIPRNCRFCGGAAHGACMPDCGLLGYLIAMNVLVTLSYVCESLYSN